MAAIVVAAGLVAVVAARLVAGGILRDVEAIRDGLVAVGRGQRDVQIETAAHDELAELAAAANAMIDQLRDEEAAATSPKPPGATWSRPSPTICARRSPRCACSPRRSATTSSRRRDAPRLPARGCAPTSTR